MTFSSNTMLVVGWSGHSGDFTISKHRLLWLKRRPNKFHIVRCFSTLRLVGKSLEVVGVHGAVI